MFTKTNFLDHSIQKEIQSQTMLAAFFVIIERWVRSCRKRIPFEYRPVE